MTKTKSFTMVFLISFVLFLSIFLSASPSSLGHTTYLGEKQKNVDMELSPKQRLFHPDEDGCFYPGSPKITKILSVCNVGDAPFRICRFYASFYGDTYLANGLQIEIMDLTTSTPFLLYNGTLSILQEGIDISGKRAIPKGKNAMLQIIVWMAKTAENDYQGLTMTADITLTVQFQPAHN